MSNVQELIVKLEKLPGPDAQIDDAIQELCVPRGLQTIQAPRYTKSIDDAMTLVPEGWNRRLSETDAGKWWSELREGYETSYNRVALASNAPSPAIALCIAALRALSHKGSSND